MYRSEYSKAHMHKHIVKLLAAQLLPSVEQELGHVCTNLTLTGNPPKEDYTVTHRKTIQALNKQPQHC